jgi:hypothetical protein
MSRRVQVHGVARALLALIVALLLGAARDAVAKAPRERLAVSVVEVAGGRAYLTPGPGRGVSIDGDVFVGRRRYRILSFTSSHIAVELKGRPLARGERGLVWASPRELRTFATRPKPEGPTAFADKWRDPVRPAEQQTTKFVPLGAATDTRRNRAAVVLDHALTQPLSGDSAAIARTRLRPVLHAELARALEVDADAVVEHWSAADLDERRGNASRPLLSVRQLELGYRGERLQAAVGRLRYAASTIGMLDGGRASAWLGESVGIAAFGGVAPDSLDTSPSSDVSRFGAELLYSGELARAPLRASLTAQGSRFAGQLDERRLTAIAESYPSFGRIGGRAEVSAFDRDNPWNAKPLELSALGADVSFRLDSLRFGLAVETRRPERSYWLAAALPPGYFCVPGVIAGSAVREPCVGGDMRTMGLLSAAWESEYWTIDIGANVVGTRHASAEQASAFLNLRRRDLLGGLLRFDAGASASSGSILDTLALNVGVGAGFFEDALDASVYYRPSVLRYQASAEALFEHGTGARLWWALFGDFDASLSGDLITGADVDVLFVQGALAWRPRF